MNKSAFAFPYGSVVIKVEKLGFEKRKQDSKLFTNNWL